MNQNLLTAGLLVVLLFGGSTSSLYAQGDDRSGTAAMEELLVPVTPRTVALGSALTGGLNGMDGVEALLSNPAALTVNAGTNAMFSRTEYLADIGINYFGIAQRFGNNNVALTVNAWDYGDIARQTPDAPEIEQGVTWDASTIVVGLTFAREFTDRIASGVTVKALGRTIDDVQASGVAFDAGMTYVVGESGLRFGVSLRNFGTQMTFDGDGLNDVIQIEGPGGSGSISGRINDLGAELPSLLSFGASYTRRFAGDISASFLADYRSNSYDLDNYSTGIEVGYQDLFFVRGGLSLSSDTDVTAWEVWNVGAGLNLNMVGRGLSVDYTYRPSSYFSSVNMFSVGFTL